MDISGFEKHVIKKILVNDEINKNSTCIVDLVVENNNLQEFVTDIKVGESSIVVSKEGDIIFSGFVERFNYEKTYLQTDVHIVASSFSQAIDSEIFNRIFQSPQKTYNKLCEFFSKNNLVIKCADEALGNQYIEEVLIQRNETDFEFLSRVFNAQHQDLYIISNKKNSCIIEIAQCRSQNSESILETDILRFVKIYEAKKERIELSTRILYDMGTLVEVYGKIYKIVSRKAVTEYDIEEINYILIPVVETEDSNKYLESYSLGMAKVINNLSDKNMGQIQVEFLEYEDVMAEEKSWIDYMSPLTEKGGGIIVLPNKDEIVEVVYSNHRLIALGCVRSVEIDENYRDVSQRYYVSNGCTCINGNKNLELVIDKNKIKVTEEIFEFSNGKFDIFINEQQCKIGFENTKILIDNDRFQILGNSNIDIKSKELNMAADNSVKVKTKSFDVG